MGIITLIDEREQKAGRQHVVGAGQQCTHSPLTSLAVLPAAALARASCPDVPSFPLPRCLRGRAALRQKLICLRHQLSPSSPAEISLSCKLFAVKSFPKLLPRLIMRLDAHGSQVKGQLLLAHCPASGVGCDGES